MAFDTELFIREIETRRAIWDTSCDDYSDREERKVKWKEITHVMCKEDLPEKEKKEFGKLLQQKWKNIRTSYIRELKRRAGVKTGSAANRKRPYIYFDQLLFLKETVKSNASHSSMDESEAPFIVKKEKKKDKSVVEISKKSIEMTEERERNYDRDQETDFDRLFLLSLLDDFKKIPEHRRLTTKMELIDVIKRAQMITVETIKQETF